MAERGGASVQSGILYQNSVAALFLGRLCDMHRRPPRERVVEVRVEAPAHVDDIVVRFADGHRDWVQVKENLRGRGEPWRHVWADFEAQRWSDEFNQGDRLVLVAGAIASSTYESLRQLCRRTEGAANRDEWLQSLNSGASALLENVGAIVSGHHQDEQSLFEMFRSLDVWPLYGLKQIQRDYLPLWMPDSSVQATTLFALLRDKVGGRDRRGGVSHAHASAGAWGD